MMKRLLFISLLSLLFGCRNPNQYQELPDGTIRFPELIYEEFTCPEDSMHLRCSDLSGLGPLIIGESTIKQATRLQIYDYFCGLDEKNVFDEWIFDYSSFEDKDIKVENNHCRVFRATNPIINGVKFYTIEMEFYDGKLVSLSFKPDKEDAMKDSYIKKYGDGIGHLNVKNYFYKDYAKDNLMTDEERVWYNSIVSLTYTKHFHSRPGQKPYLSSEFKLVDKTGLYDRFLEERDSLISKFKQQRSSVREESYNSII